MLCLTRAFHNIRFSASSAITTDRPSALRSPPWVAFPRCQIAKNDVTCHAADKICQNSPFRVWAISVPKIVESLKTKCVRESALRHSFLLDLGYKVQFNSRFCLLRLHLNAGEGR